MGKNCLYWYAKNIPKLITEEEVLTILGMTLRSLQKTNLNTTQIYLDVIGDDIKKDF